MESEKIGSTLYGEVPIESPRHVRVSETTIIVDDEKSALLVGPPHLSSTIICSAQKPKGNWKFNSQCIAVNACATIAIVFLNKVIFADPQLKNCQVLFAIWHFLVTFLVLYVSSRRPFQIFEAVRLPLLQLVPICGLFAGFVILGNLSLAFNSVGFYQLAKIVTTPTVVLFNFLLFRKTVSRTKLLAVVAVCGGVALTNSRAAVVNPLGAVIAVAAFSVTALYQIWIGKKIGDFACSAPQLLLNQTPVAILMLVPFVPLLDTLPDLSAITPKIAWCFVASGLTAAVINLSQFLIIGETSALTFNIVGMMKTIAILSLGWLLEDQLLTMQDLLGVFAALSGAWIYAQSSSEK